MTRRLPLVAALVAFAVYVCTMGGGVTVGTLPLVAKVAGWDAVPIIGQPLLWLLMLPLHLLPVAWVTPAVKLFAAALAAAILGLLARTIQLLPWDRAWDSASRLTVMLPAVAACAICGLEFSFWQEATSSCGELLDLLLLATALWLLLEYKARRDSAWLNAAAIVWGAGMAENWVMALTLPLFIGGVIWLQGLRFFRVKFILRLTGLGLAGFSLYLLLPLVNGLTPHSPWNLEQSWLATLHQTKSAAVLVYYGFWRLHRLLTMAIIIYFLVPTLPLLIRIKDEGMRNKSGVDRFQLWIYRGLRLGLLVACLWLAFDPVIASRQMVHRELGGWLPMLTFDYVNALGAGFLLGCLLLTSLPDAGSDGYRRSRNRFAWRKLVVPVATVGLGVAVVGLAARNAPAILRYNFHPVEEFGRLAVKSLPPGGGIVLSDMPDKLLVFQAALAHEHQTANWLAVDTRALPTAEYRARLERRHPGDWLTGTNRHELLPSEMLRLLEHLAQTNRLFYLNPSYGYFFERFYLEPSGAIYEMKLRGNDPLAIPPLPAAITEANEQFWTGAWNKDLARLAPPSRRLNFFEKRMERLGLEPAPRLQDLLLAQWYSLSLDTWAVALQRDGRFREAHARLEEALQLNTNNLSARITMACNTNLQAGRRMTLSDVPKVADQLGKLDRLNLIMNSGGPFDEPTVGYLLGSSFLGQGLVLQAAGQLERVRTLAPDAMAPELALAEIYNRLQMTSRSEPLIQHLREKSRQLPANSSLDLNLALLESYSSLLETNTARAREVLTALVEQHPDDPQINSRVLAAYLAFGDLTNALRLADAKLAKTPDDVTSLNNKAIILLQTGRSTEAISLLDHVLMLTNQPTARINRAFARINMKDFASAERDLRELQKEGADSGMVDFGLASLAEHNHDTNQAARYLQICLTNTLVGSPLWRQASARLHTLEPAAMTQ